MDSADVDQTTPFQRGSYDYPTRDGRPFDSDCHREAIFETIATLRDYYAGQQVYVTGCLLVFYREGDRRRFVAPDVMVVKGAEPGLRLNYLLWEERCSPSVVIEVTSSRTAREDTRKKFDVYRTELAVKEYFLFDPHDDYLTPRLQGFELIDGQYAPIEPVANRLPSRELGLQLRAVGASLWFYDLPL